MKNLFKKLLACCLAICMVVTLCVSALTVSAAGETGSVTVADTTVSIGEEIVVPVTITGDATAGLAAADVYLDVDGLSITKLDLDCADENVYITFASAADPDGEPEVLEVDNAETEEVDESVSTVAPNVVDNEFIFVVTTYGDVVTKDEVVLNITFAALEAEATKTVAVTAETEACYDGENDLLALTNEDGTITVEAEAEECAHEWEMTEVKDATETEDGWIIYECTKCDIEPDVQTVKYWSRHTFYKRNINMASQIELNFKIREDRFNDSTLGNATEAFAKITVNTDFGEETSYVTGLEDYAVTVNPGDSRNIRTVVVALAAKQMMDEVTANTFIKVGNQWYSGASKTETVESLAQDIYEDIGETERTLYANLLTYGARAQEYFGYKADTLADANLGDYASYVTSDVLTFDGSIEQTYSTDDAEGDSSIRTYKYGLTMAAKTEANLRVRLDKYVPFPEISTVTAKLTYGVGDDIITTNVASSEFTFFESNSSGDRYTFSYADVYPKCMRDDVTLVFFVNGVATDNVVTFSIENIVSKVYSNSTATEQAMYQAMMHYADAAKAHFG